MSASNSMRCIFLCAAGIATMVSGVTAEAVVAADLPVIKVSLYSSGVGYFEHSGTVSGNGEASLPFSLSAVNDVLKSLVITDPASSSPSVSYPSEDTLVKTLRSLKVDLSGSPGVAEILNSLRGSELLVSVPEAVTGRIIGVEARPVAGGGGDESSALATEAFLSLFTKDGIRTFSLREISSFTFTDKKISEDLSRALDLILSSRDADTRVLRVNLPGKGERSVTLGYVVQAPVWKVSYRLDLANEKPFLQGWAIVDNAGVMDWNNVSLSLVTGRPVSFIQNLYPPLILSRPVLPLSIAGIAEAQTYDSGYGASAEAEYAEEYLSDRQEAYAPAPAMAKSSAMRSNGEAKKNLSAGLVETTVARSAGEQFEFTVRKPVNLPRQQSAMIPLVEAQVKAQKVSVFSGEKAQSGGSVHPMLCAELTNSTGMKLPAGPITVFDDGAYAGDALIEFFSENDKRFISYGEDLSVTGSLSTRNSQETTAVTISRGVMTFYRKYTYIKEYALRNASARSRKIIIEHPVIQNAELIKPAKFDERTDRLYRFGLSLVAGGETKFEVKEQINGQETVVLFRQQLDTILQYCSSSEIPAKVKAALEKAVEFKKKADEAQEELTLLDTQKKEKISEQDRIRKNLEAAGNETQQGKEYLRKLTVADTDIDALGLKIDAARKNVQATKAAYEMYLSNLTLD